MTNEHNEQTAPDEASKRPIRYVDFDIFENIRLRISLRLLIVLAGTLIGVTTTTVVTYNNMRNKIDRIENKVDAIGNEFNTLKEKNGEAIHNLEKNDINIKNEIETLKKEKQTGSKN